VAGKIKILGMARPIKDRLNLICFLCIFICVQATLYADGGLYLFPKGAKATGMGKNGLLNVDIWSVYNNQAALASIENAGAGLYYENRFAMNQLDTSVGAFVFSCVDRNFQVQYCAFWYRLLRRNKNRNRIRQITCCEINKHKTGL
jgi:hypothetical protein